MSINITQVSFSEIKPHTVILLIGPRGSGKSTIIKWLYHYNRNKVRLPIIMSATADQSGDFDKIIHPAFIFDTYEPNVLSKLLINQMAMRMDAKKPERAEYWENKKKDCILTMDDLLADKSVWKSHNSFRETIFNGRHYFMTLIITVQDLMEFPHEFRDNVDYVIITNVGSKNNIDKLFKYYWDERFANLNEFNQIISTCTQGYYSMLIDRKSGRDKGELSEYVKILSPKDPNFIPSEFIGSKPIINLCKKLYNPDWPEQKIIKMIEEDEKHNHKKSKRRIVVR